MERHGTVKYIIAISLLAALVATVMPAAAMNGTISIAYRGSGGYYIGDTIIFDGQNTFGNVTLIRMTGPGLPAEGVPAYNLDGEAGTGNIIPVGSAGSWKFVWYTGTISGIEKMQTGRYYLTVFDNTYPDKTAITSILIKKPEFFVVATPGTAGYGDYIELTGTAETGVANVHFDIADAEGKTVHTYDSTVSSSGYFNKGFHIDMAPGTYTITMSSPTVRTTYRNYLTVAPAASSTGTPAANTTISVDATPTIQSSPTVSSTQHPAEDMGLLSITSDPMGATVFIDSVMMGPTPFKPTPVSPGTHLVEIKAPGYVTFSVQVVVKAGENVEISPSLVRSSSAMPLSVPTVIAGIFITLALALVSVRHRQS